MEFISIVIEVANGDYGSFTPQLVKAAALLTCEHRKKTKEDDENDLPVIKVDTLQVTDTPLLKKQTSFDSKEIYTTPSEWSKFWTLVSRCQTHYYRDWVSSMQSRLQFLIKTRFILRLQTVTYLKLILHILCACLIGLLYGDSGSNASKAIQNVGFLLVGVAYLWYTTVMPGVLKCKSNGTNCRMQILEIKPI